MAARPGLWGLDWPDGFATLEHEVGQLAAELTALPYERLDTPSPADLPPRPGPRHGDREGWVARAGRCRPKSSGKCGK
jgi:hypothetical protein